MPLSIGQVLAGRYRVDALLGQGGFGAVYRVWDLNLNRPRALKENLDTSAEAQRQFGREAAMLADLSHPNLPRVLDYFFIPGYGQYLIMDFIEGEDLQTMLEHARGPLPEAQVVAWLTQVCDALMFLHQQNPPIVHRDVKPANIKITPAGKAVLVDFGIAKVFDIALKTTIGAKAVTPGYSPPEQYGQGQTDTRSDVYATGATLYALLAGQEPIESIARFAGQSLRPPSAYNAQITRRVEAGVMRALKLDPADRFQSIGDLKLALAAAPTSAIVVGRRQKMILAGVVAGLVIGAIALLLLSYLFKSNSGSVSATATPRMTEVITTLTVPSATLPAVGTLAPSRAPTVTPLGATPTHTPEPNVLIVKPSDTPTATEIMPRAHS